MGWRGMRGLEMEGDGDENKGRWGCRCASWWVLISGDRVGRGWESGRWLGWGMGKGVGERGCRGGLRKTVDGGGDGGALIGMVRGCAEVYIPHRLAACKSPGFNDKAKTLYTQFARRWDGAE